MACIGNQVRPCDLRLHLMKVFWRLLFKLLVGNSSSFISFGFICLLQRYVGISLGFSLVEGCYEEFKYSSSHRSNRPVGLKALSDCYFLPRLVNFFFPFRRFLGCQLLWRENHPRQQLLLMQWASHQAQVQLELINQTGFLAAPMHRVLVLFERFV